MPFSVFIVDDHAVVREGIRSTLQVDAAFTVVGEAADGLEAVRLIERLRPDLLVLDLLVPGLNGLDVLRLVRQRSPHTRIVVLSMHDTSAYVAEALHLGALGYVLKGSRIADLVTALHEAAAGRRYLSPPLLAKDIEDYCATPI